MSSPKGGAQTIAGLGGDVRSRTKFHGFPVLRVRLIAGQALLSASAKWLGTTLRKCARQNNELGCFSNVRKHNVQLYISCLVLSKLVCGNLSSQDYCQAGPKIYTCSEKVDTQDILRDFNHRQVWSVDLNSDPKKGFCMQNMSGFASQISLSTKTCCLLCLVCTYVKFPII